MISARPWSASDFGNNYGLIVGGAVAGWRDLPDAELVCETLIDGVPVGSGNASGVLGGPAGALAWLAGHLAGRGRPLLAAQWVTTGAVTGIHRIGPDQSAEVRFRGSRRYPSVDSRGKLRDLILVSGCGGGRREFIHQTKPLSLGHLWPSVLGNSDQLH
jgi:2-keto-4-pentenoate hydratase